MSDKAFRKIERIDNSFGTELFSIVECDNKKIRCDVADYNALGFRLICRTPEDFSVLVKAEISLAKVLYGTYLLGFISVPKVLRAQESQLSLVVGPSERSKMEIVARPRRADIPYLLEPTLVGPDPVRPRENLIMRVDNISEKGFRAKCSLTNKHLVIGQTFTNFAFHIPSLGVVGCDFKITNSRVSTDFLMIGCEFQNPDERFRKMLSEFLLLCWCIEKNEQHDFEGEQLPRKLSALLRVRKIDQTLEMDSILDLRFKAYKEANKITADASAKSMRDEFDANSIILGAYLGSKVVGTLRIAFSKEGSQLPFEKFFNFPLYLNSSRANSVEVSRMAIDPAAQGSDIFFRLMQSLALEFMPKREFAYLMSTEELAKNYIAIGATKLAGPVPHPVAKGQFLSLYVVETQKIKSAQMSALSWLFFGKELVEFLSRFGFAEMPKTPVFKILSAPFELLDRRTRKMRRRLVRKRPAA